MRSTPSPCSNMGLRYLHCWQNLWKTHEWIVKFDVDTQPQMSPREEGWTRHQEKWCEATLFGADGVVAHKTGCRNAFRHLRRERPPRLRRFGSFATFS